MHHEIVHKVDCVVGAELVCTKWATGSEKLRRVDKISNNHPSFACGQESASPQRCQRQARASHRRAAQRMTRGAENSSGDEEDELWGSTEARRTWRAAAAQVCIFSQIRA